jgi:hypothetical protein
VKFISQAVAVLNRLLATYLQQKQRESMAMRAIVLIITKDYRLKVSKEAFLIKLN